MRVTPLFEFTTPEDHPAQARLRREILEAIPKQRLVIWRYRHHINSRTSTIRTKVGEYVGKRRHTVKHWRKPGAEQMAAVQFTDNRRVTFVPLDDLEFVTSYKELDR